MVVVVVVAGGVVVVVVVVVVDVVFLVVVGDSNCRSNNDCSSKNIWFLLPQAIVRCSVYFICSRVNFRVVAPLMLPL